jgi:hypothetical protein
MAIISIIIGVVGFAVGIGTFTRWYCLIKVRRFVTGTVLRLRLPFVVIDVCCVLLRYGIINSGSTPNHLKGKGSGPFRPILLDFPSLPEQNLQLIEAVDNFSLHNTPCGQAAGARKL